MKLDYLLKGQHVLEQHGKTDIEITGLTTDSRAVEKGYLFVAVKGSNEDGHRYLDHAIQRGARALLVEQGEKPIGGVTVIRVPDTRVALSELASRFYQYPTRNVNLIGITGTNGKTTTSYLLETILMEAGREVGVIGTISYRFKEKSFGASLTTPESTDLMRMMREMKDAGITDIIVEVSSHSLDQGRTRGLKWSRAIFTSFSRDHLDYHSSMEEYFRAKSLLFDSLGENQKSGEAKAIINMDDPKGTILQKITKVPNVYNILAAAATAFSYDIDPETIARGIKRLSYIPGRLQRVENKRGLSVLVDYAHTPDALEKVLQTVKQFAKARLITVFGCGGDRDRGKRPEMGKIAGNYGDLVIITSDNPRGEDPAAIVGEIEPGIRESGLDKVNPDLPYNSRGYQIILDRRKAIQAAIQLAHKEDIVVIAGKGHEDYQIIGKTKRYFSDVEEAANAAS
jgi:UDP-N-acetylmuramoyl-L-alanyl-D-glutamate--2,6-diaminopimelate ligase